MRFIASVAALCAALVLPLSAISQPSGSPIRLIVPFGAGSGVDAGARSFSKALIETSSQAVIVDNRAGAEGLIGAKVVMSAAPDGLTVMFTSNSVPTLLPALKRTPPFDPSKDLVPVCSISKSPMNVFIRASLPFKTFGEFAAAAKANPDKYTFAYSTGLNRLGIEWLQQMAGIKLRGIPYKATAQALTELFAGEVDLILADASTALAHYKSGKLRPLVAADERRSTALPDTPAAPEVGLKGFSVSVWTALYLPAKTPADVASRLQHLVRATVVHPVVQDADKAAGREQMLLCGNDLVQMQKAEIAHWKQLVNTARIELE